MWLSLCINNQCSFVDALYIQIDKPYGDVEDEFVWAQTW